MADRNIRPVSLYKNSSTLTQITTGNNIEKYEYNDYGAISRITYSGEVARTVSYTYESTSKMRLIRMLNGDHFIEYGYDSLGRNNNRIIIVNNVEVYKQTIAYTAGLNCTTTMPAGITYNDGSSITYKYDELGNIKKITTSNKSIDYMYDKFGRLIREDNQEQGKSYFYTYDDKGNITKKETCSYTTGSQKVGSVTVIDYVYNGNKLTSFNGESCTYDSIGNPTTYRGKTATWKGRQLQSYNGTTFGYDGLGRRMSKTVNGTKTEYVYDSEDKLLKSTDGMEYFYDETGVTAFKYYGVLYIYKKDIQNNITAILDSNGNTVVNYYYDAWGNHKVLNSDGTENTSATFIGNLNPFRYRSYFYDTETKLYFLQSRYYDPEVGRFLNMDSVDYADPETLGGLNLYVYCGNNPVMGYDPSGTWNWDSCLKVMAWVALGVSFVAATVLTGGAGIVASIALGATAGGLVGGYMNEDAGGSFGAGWLGGAVNGTIQTIGYLTCGYIGTIFGGGIGAGIGTFITESLNCAQQGKEYNLQRIVDKSVSAGFSSAITSIFTAGVQFLATSGVGSIVGGSVFDKIAGSVFGPGFANIVSSLFGMIDDYFSYLLSPYLP